MIIKMKRKGLGKKLRLHKVMKEIGEPMSTIEIYELYNEKYPTTGYTMHELSNVLAKNPIFQKVGHVYEPGRNMSLTGINGKYNSRYWCVWDVIYFDEVVKI